MRYVTLPTVSVGTATAVALVPATYQGKNDTTGWTVLAGSDIHVASDLASATTNSPWVVRGGDPMNFPGNGPLFGIAATATNTVKMGESGGLLP